MCVFYCIRADGRPSTPPRCAFLATVAVLWLLALKPFEASAVMWVSAVAPMVKVGEQESHRVPSVSELDNWSR